MANISRKVYNFSKPVQTFSTSRISASATPISASNKRTNISNFLTTYYDFAYFIFCSPFRLVADEGGWFLVRSWFPHKILVAFLHGLNCLFFLSNIRKIYPTVTSEQNPLGYFQLLSIVFSISFQSITLKRLWFNREEVASIVNYIKSESHTLPNGYIKIQNKNFSRLICIVFAVMPFYEVIMKQIIAPSSSWGVTWWNRKLVSDARYAFFISNLTESKVTPEPGNLKPLDYFLAVIMGVGWIARFMLGFYLDLGLLFAVFTFWTATFHFSRQLKRDTETFPSGWSTLAQSHQIPSITDIQFAHKFPRRPKWPEIYQTYQAIRHLTELINVAYGSMLTMYMADSILFHSMSMDAVLVATDISKQLRLLFFICNSTLAFLLSADGCSKLDSLMQWLAKDENRRDIPMDQMNIVIHELQTHSVGIRGSNIFTITYNLLWHMMTTVVTYFIICIQTRQQQQQQHADTSANNKTTVITSNVTQA